MAPCGNVFPAKIICLERLFGRMTVDAGAATRLIVVFLGSLASELTATGMAVVTSMPPCSQRCKHFRFVMREKSLVVFFIYVSIERPVGLDSPIFVRYFSKHTLTCTMMSMLSMGEWYF